MTRSVVYPRWSDAAPPTTILFPQLEGWRAEMARSSSATWLSICWPSGVLPFTETAPGGTLGTIATRMPHTGPARCAKDWTRRLNN